MEQVLLLSPPPSTLGLALTSALIGALCVHTELVGSTAGSLCATLVNVCREAGRAGVSVSTALAGKPRPGLLGNRPAPTQTVGQRPQAVCQRHRCCGTQGCPARDCVFQSASKLSMT